MIVHKLLKTSVILCALFGVFYFFVSPVSVNAQYYPEPGTVIPNTNEEFVPLGCPMQQGDKVTDPRERQRTYCFYFRDILDDRATNQDVPVDLCVENNITLGESYNEAGYREWLEHPDLNFWVEDPEVTSLGRGGERSRQFLLWTLSRQSIDDHKVILEVWQLSQNVALFLILLVVIVMGLGIIIGQKYIGFIGNLPFTDKLEITPMIIKIALLLVFIIFSARFVLIIIQLSDVMMEFFIRQLGVRNLFNIFFLDQSGSGKSLTEVLSNSEGAYQSFIGCTNWNVHNQEMVTTSKALVKFTNMTYYFIGGMLILRKIVLWFLIIVSPFLAILAPFVFIRNIGWIWVGVFFQWVFYGPLFALFLGGLANIWNGAPVHIPYIFDFSRTHDAVEMVYPTSINILYGGPAQQLGFFNSANYVDTFTEYLISLLMLWTALILPWWLLRIFRDYCCEGIYATKNIMMNMYDQMRTGPTPGGPGPKGDTPGPTGVGKMALDIPGSSTKKVQAVIKLETPQQIKQAQTQQILQTIEIEAKSVVDVAQMETNKAQRNQITSNLNQIQNPFKAETATERQRLMNIRNEVQARAGKGDQMAQRLAAVTARSSTHEKIAREKLINSMPKVEVPKTTAVISTMTIKAAVPLEKTQRIVQSAMTSLSANDQFVHKVAQETGISSQQATNMFQTFGRFSTIDTKTDDIIAKTAQELGISEEKVKQIVSKATTLLKTRSDMIDTIARQEGLDKETVERVLQSHFQEMAGVTSDKSTQILKQVLNKVSYDKAAIQQISQQSQISAATTQQVLQQLGQTDDFDVSAKNVVVNTASAVNAPHDDVKKVLENTASYIASNNVLMQNVAEEENVEQETVEDIAKSQIEALSKADKDIEDYVPDTQKVSIEDYEEVKSMWLKHYEGSEIPMTENVQSREEWVEQDIVRITNILNKLMSSDQKMQNDGLTEVGYILPIFMVNNMSGEELLVYLKAKVQAAKQISREMEKELQVKAGMKGEEEFVDIDVKKAVTAAKQKTLKKELKIGGAGARSGAHKVDVGVSSSSGEVSTIGAGGAPTTAGQMPAPKINITTTGGGAGGGAGANLDVSTIRDIARLEIKKTLTAHLQKATATQGPITDQMLRTILDPQKRQLLYTTLPQVQPVMYSPNFITKGFNTDKTLEILTVLFAIMADDRRLLNAITIDTQLPVDVVHQLLLTVGSSDMLHRSPIDILDESTSITKLTKQQITSVVSSAQRAMKGRNDIYAPVAEREQVEDHVVIEVSNTYLDSLLKAKDRIEELVPKSEKVSTEDYEEVKGMWLDQYEKGEVPVSGMISDRAGWIEQDIVTITNVMNRLLSSQQSVREQGMSEVEYILPVFVINNLTGDELMTYLKAKLEAAKQVKWMMEHADEKVAEDEASKVMVDRPKAVPDATASSAATSATTIPDATASSAVPSATTIPDATVATTTPDTAVSQAATPQTATPQGKVSQAVTPQGTASQAVTPQGTVPQISTPQASDTGSAGGSGVDALKSKLEKEIGS